MRVVTDLTAPAWHGERTVVAIGTFDGLHLGHQLVLRHTCMLAAELGARSAVVVLPPFDPRPSASRLAGKLLTEPDHLISLLGDSGIGTALVADPDAGGRRSCLRHFVDRALSRVFSAQAVVMGTEALARVDEHLHVRELCRSNGCELLTVEALAKGDGGEPVSCRSIRHLLEGGRVEAAASMLGRPFELRGWVVKGDQRGRTLGFPTANVEVPSRMCVPADGVYAGFFVRPDGSAHRCAVNLGRRPTFYERSEHSLLEAHLIDFDGNLYGERAVVHFQRFLRSERRFTSVEGLIGQLQADVELARAVLV